MNSRVIFKHSLPVAYVDKNGEEVYKIEGKGNTVIITLGKYCVRFMHTHAHTHKRKIHTHVTNLFLFYCTEKYGVEAKYSWQMFGIYPHIEINIDHEKNKDGGLCGKNHTYEINVIYR